MKVSKNPAHTKNTQKYSIKSDTLIEALEKRAESSRDFILFMDTKNREMKLTVKEALSGAEAVAQYLLSAGLEKGNNVMVMLPTSMEFIYIYYGILMAGGVPVPVSQPAGTSNISKYLENLKHIIINSESKFFITYDKIKMIIGSLMSVPNLVKEFIFTEELFNNPVPRSKYQPLPKITRDDIALIQYTSGTTGKPKGVMLTHGNLIHNIHGIGVAAGLTEEDTAISWLPLYHDMGLIGGHLTTMYWNTGLIFMTPESFLFRPQWWLENITKYRATISVAPNFGYHYCVSRISDNVIPKLDLSSWRLALNGAEPIDRITLQKFLDKFKPTGIRDDLFFPVYGMAENSLAATFPALDNTTVVKRFDRVRLEEEHVAVDTNTSDSKKYIDLVSVGYPLLGQEIRIVDEKGKTLKEREVGQILVKSKSLTIGYYKNEEATNETLKDGWLYTGDMGFIVDEMLFISGRIKEMIIKRGKNIYPYDVERIAGAVPGVRLGCTAAFSMENPNEGTEDLILVCETLIKDKREQKDLKNRIQNDIVAKLGIAPDDIKLVPKGTIPKTTSGKIQRILCKKLYLQPEIIPRRHINKLVLLWTVTLSSLNLVLHKGSRIFRKNPGS